MREVEKIYRMKYKEKKGWNWKKNLRDIRDMENFLRGCNSMLKKDKIEYWECFKTDKNDEATDSSSLNSMKISL